MDNFLEWLGQAASQIGDLITLVASNVFQGLPTTAVEIVKTLFGDTISQKLDGFYQSLLVGPRLEETPFFYILAFVSAIATAILFLKAGQYILKVAAYHGQYSSEEILRGRTALTSPLVYIPMRLFPAALVVIWAPLIFAASLLALQLIVRDAVLSIYGGQTIGDVTYDLILRMLEGQGIIWFALSFVFFLVLLAIFLIVYALVHLWAIAMAAWTMIQIARYGDGESSGIVLTDAALTTVKALTAVTVLYAEIIFGPAVLSAAPLSWFPVALGLIVWLSLMIATPAILWFVMPKVERVVVNSLSKVTHTIQHVVSPAEGYEPYNKILIGRTEGRTLSEEQKEDFWDSLKRVPGRVNEIYQAYQRVT